MNEFPGFFSRGIGVVFLLSGAYIIAIFWVYFLRQMAALFCIGSPLKFSSMAPAIGPCFILVGAYLFGEPVFRHVGWWVWLVDANTYAFVLALPFLLREVWRTR